MQWLGLGAFTAVGPGSISGPGSKILQASAQHWGGECGEGGITKTKKSIKEKLCKIGEIYTNTIIILDFNPLSS